MSLSVSIKVMAGATPIEAEFESGSGITALFGPSGAGKTTVLKAVAGMMRPVSGRIALGETVLFDSEAGINVAMAQRRTGFVFQDGRLFPHMSVARNLRYAAWAGRRTDRNGFERVADLLGLKEFLERRPVSLSGGERQRVAIGRALLSDPAILLMDEPLSSLDHERRAAILPYLEAVRDEARIPILYVSHEIDEVARLADTVAVMARGRMAGYGTVADMFARMDLGAAIDRRDAGVLLDGVITGTDDEYAMVRVEVDGQGIELAAGNLAIGAQVRLHVHARDVAIARTVPVGLSIRNCLAARVEHIVMEGVSDADVGLVLANQKLRARITRKSAVEMGLAPGDQVFALLKAVSVEGGAMRRAGIIAKQWEAGDGERP